MTGDTRANRTEADDALEESVHSALTRFRLGHIGARAKQVLVDEAFAQYRRALAARQSHS
ncbi:TPA: hypothetical protein ACKP9S_006471 [Pseudomonas aeruginosa]